MKNLIIITLSIMSLVLVAGFTLNSMKDHGEKPLANSEFGEEMVAIMENQKAYTLELMNLMPEDKYNYRPNEEVRSFGELFKHLAGSFQLQQKVLKGEFTTPEKEFPAVQQLEKSEMSKQAIINLISKEMDNMISLMADMNKKELKTSFTFGFIPGAPVKTNREIFVFSRDHLTHHRGQATTYLRLNGIKPSAYRPW